MLLDLNNFVRQKMIGAKTKTDKKRQKTESRMLISEHTQYGKVQTKVSYGKPGQDKARVR